MQRIRENQFALSIMSVFVVAGMLFLTLSIAAAKLILPAPTRTAYVTPEAPTPGATASEPVAEPTPTSTPMAHADETPTLTPTDSARATAALTASETVEDTADPAPVLLEAPTIAAADLALSPDVTLSAQTALAAAPAHIEGPSLAGLTDTPARPLAGTVSALTPPELAAQARFDTRSPAPFLSDQQPATLSILTGLSPTLATPDAPLRATSIATDQSPALANVQVAFAETDVTSALFGADSRSALQTTAPAPKPIEYVQTVDQDRVLSVTPSIQAPSEGSIVVPASAAAPAPLRQAHIPQLPELPVIAMSVLTPAVLSLPAQQTSVPEVTGDLDSTFAFAAAALERAPSSMPRLPLLTPVAARTVQAALPTPALPSPAVPDVTIEPQVIPTALAAPTEDTLQAPEDQIVLSATAPVSSLRPVLRPSDLARRAAATTAAATPKPAPTTSPVQTAAAAAPAPTPAPAPVASAAGMRVSVIGVFETKAASWALLQLGDGRIVKVTSGANMKAFQVTKIRGNKVWIKSGSTAKAFGTGSSFTVR